MSDEEQDEDDQDFIEDSDNEFIVDEDLKEDYKMYDDANLDE